jgi:cell wall assembly regulator SMI1
MFAALRKVRRAHPDWFGSGCTRDELASVEVSLGVRLPNDYRAFLQEFGWAETTLTQINGAGVGVPGHLDVVRETAAERSLFEPNLPANLVPISNDGAGSHYCVDLTSPSMPNFAPVVYFAHDNPAGSSQLPETVDASFEAWVERKILSEVESQEL